MGVDVLSWREAARRLNESPHAIRGAVITQGWAVVKVGNANVLTEAQYRVLEQQWRRHASRAS
mgnify:CR=1 FL=1